MWDAINEIISFTDEIRYEGFTHALLLGMGGSSLTPEVFRCIRGVKAGHIDLEVLDSTTPGAVLDFDRKSIRKKHFTFLQLNRAELLKHFPLLNIFIIRF